MNNDVDLETMREIFKDVRQHISIGKIVQLGLADDHNTLRVQCLMYPDQEREVVAEMTWDDINDCDMPEINDLVLLGFADGDDQTGYVIRFLSTIEEPIPSEVASGAKVVRSRSGKKLYIGGDTTMVEGNSIGIGKKGHTPSEPLVLGNVLVSMLTDLLTALTQSPLGETNLSTGITTLDPGIVSALNQIKSTYLTTSSSNIVSQVAFTERGT